MPYFQCYITDGFSKLLYKTNSGDFIFGSEVKFTMSWFPHTDMRKA